MKAICQNCHKVKQLTRCEICGARICHDCKLESGCKVCYGRKMMK